MGIIYRHLNIFFEVFFLTKSDFFPCDDSSCLASLPAGSACTGSATLSIRRHWWAQGRQEQSLCRPSPFCMKSLLREVPRSDGNGTTVLSPLSSPSSWQAGSPRSSLQLKPLCSGPYSSGSCCLSPGPCWLPSPPLLFLGQRMDASPCQTRAALNPPAAPLSAPRQTPCSETGDGSELGMVRNGSWLHAFLMVKKLNM